jgi:hypothetical protein
VRFVSAPAFKGCGKIPVKAGFGKGTSLQLAEKLRSKPVLGRTSLLVPLSRWKCVCASAPEVCFLRRDEFFRSLFRHAAGSLASSRLQALGFRDSSFITGT